MTVEKASFFFKEKLNLLVFYKFKGWIDELLGLTWKACEDTDVILESPSAMVGIHMAEKLRKFI